MLLSRVASAFRSVKGLKAALGSRGVAEKSGPEEVVGGVTEVPSFVGDTLPLGAIDGSGVRCGGSKECCRFN